jgi:hypothetical protein
MKQHRWSGFAGTIIVAEILFIILALAPSRAFGQWVITYREGTSQRIYAFVQLNGHLYVNYCKSDCDGSGWKWARQGKPPGTSVAIGPALLGGEGHPAVVTYREGTQPRRIHAFVRGANGHLYRNYWDGSGWKWADQGIPPGSIVDGDPGIITYREGTQPQRIYAFVRGKNGHLYVNYCKNDCDGSGWKWRDQGTPPGTSVASNPGVITFQPFVFNHPDQPQQILTFVTGEDGHLYKNYWDGSGWYWEDLGSPGELMLGTDRDEAPAVITYRRYVHQWIYVFVKNVLRSYMRYWDGSVWKWADRDRPHNAAGRDVFFASALGVITYQEGSNDPRIYAFARGHNDHLYVNYCEHDCDGSGWMWADRGDRAGADPEEAANALYDLAELERGTPGVITYREDTQPQRIYAFVWGEDGHLYRNYWDGSGWYWADQGSPIRPRPVAITYREVTQPQKIYAFVQSNNFHLHMNYWDGSGWYWADRGAPSQHFSWGGKRLSPGPPSGDPGVITYRDDTQHQRIYAFVRGRTKALYVNYCEHHCDGSGWKWSDQRSYLSPLGAISAAWHISANPGVITYREGTQPQQIHAFVTDIGGHLYRNYWDGSGWYWADQGIPPDTHAVGAPSVITYREGTQPQRIYAFVRGKNGHLYVNYCKNDCDGSGWKWSDQGSPSGTSVEGDPAAITYKWGTQPQRIYTFVRGGDDHLYRNYWDGSGWKWADQGSPSGTSVEGDPGVITFPAQPQRIYAFVAGRNGHLYVSHCDEYDCGVSGWTWVDQGKPPDSEAWPNPGVITYREGLNDQRIYAFVWGQNGHLYVNYCEYCGGFEWSGWQWRDQGTP